LPASGFLLPANRSSTSWKSPYQISRWQWGILLFIIAVVDLIFPERTRTFPKETLGIVPIGIPLIVGPGVLTLLLISAQTYGYVSTVLCLILNLLIVWLVFGRSHLIMRLLKEGGTKGMGKVFALFLAAFAMMMIRTGITEWIGY
jgi:multiple antibiotic resistance protein